MIKLKRSEVEKFEYVGTGTFGKIYRKDELAYKVYHKKVNDSMHNIFDNPVLKYRPLKFNRLIKLNKKIEHTDLIDDVLFLDDKFSGIVRPYYDGITLDKIKDTSLDYRLGMAYQLLNNSKELAKNYIYPLDYKLNNMLVLNDTLKLLDLDDIYTKVSLIPNVLYERQFIIGLDETIKALLNEYHYYGFSEEVNTFLEHRNLKVNKTYTDIEKYLETKKNKYTYLFITLENDILKTIKFLRNPKYRVVILVDKFKYRYDDIEKELSKFVDTDFNIYDVIPQLDFNQFINDNAYDDCLEIKNKKLVKKR